MVTGIRSMAGVRSWPTPSFPEGVEGVTPILTRRRTGYCTITDGSRKP
uniref:Uncharacterized protein n=1 Tax=Timema douglasi TaxID=61478 RepID=A0A7R8ZFQ2_TIMDO|nr:unnamed protein product [Timema douglasi]